MSKLFSIFFFMLLAPVIITHAQVNCLGGHYAQSHVDQARFLVQNGIPQEEVLEIFKDSLENEKLCSDKPKNNKILWTIAGCCVVAVVIGGTYYFFVKKQTQNTPPQQHPTPNQPAQQNPQVPSIQNAPRQGALPQDLVALFDDNAFDQEAAMQVQLEPLILRAAAVRPEILPLYQQHLLAIREHNLENFLATGYQLRNHLQNPEIEAAIQGFRNDYPDQIRGIDLIANDPNRARRLEAVNRYAANRNLENN